MSISFSKCKQIIIFWIKPNTNGQLFTHLRDTRNTSKVHESGAWCQSSPLLLAEIQVARRTKQLASDREQLAHTRCCDFDKPVYIDQSVDQFTGRRHNCDGTNTIGKMFVFYTVQCFDQSEHSLYRNASVTAYLRMCVTYVSSVVPPQLWRKTAIGGLVYHQLIYPTWLRFVQSDCPNCLWHLWIKNKDKQNKQKRSASPHQFGSRPRWQKPETYLFNFIYLFITFLGSLYISDDFVGILKTTPSPSFYRNEELLSEDTTRPPYW